VDFSFTPEQAAFRAEVRRFIKEQTPQGWLGNGWLVEEDGEQRELGLAFARRLAQRGWLFPDWPKEYGGAGMTPIESLIYHEEMGYHEAPDMMGGEAGYIGPTVYTFGTPEQKARYLPGMTSATEFWCQLYSEPGTGSDLAGLQTSAASDGDDYVVNGSKIWTSQGHHSDFGLLLARTDPSVPKHKGLSMFLIDMKSQGIDVRPLINMGGFKGFNQIFFDNVRIPRSALIGEQNTGWKLAVANLDFERGSTRWAANCQRRIERAVAALKQRDPGRENTVLWHRAAQLAIDVEVCRVFNYRVASMEAAGILPNYEASIGKMFGSELNQRLSRVSTEIQGVYGQAYDANTAWWPASDYLTSVSSTIESGTSEVQRNIIAIRGLGLPRA